jgi:hypothetical protein
MPGKRTTGRDPMMGRAGKRMVHKKGEPRRRMSDPWNAKKDVVGANSLIPYRWRQND